MKKIIIILLLSTLLVSCTKNSPDKIGDKYTNYLKNGNFQKAYDLIENKKYKKSNYLKTYNEINKGLIKKGKLEKSKNGISWIYNFSSKIIDKETLNKLTQETFATIFNEEKQIPSDEKLKKKYDKYYSYKLIIFKNSSGNYKIKNDRLYEHIKETLEFANEMEEIENDITKFIDDLE